MLKPDDVYKKVEDKWVSRAIMDEVVIMPLCRSEEDMRYIYSISNETGSRIWQFLNGSHSVSDIQEALKAEYQGNGELIERDILEFIADLCEAGLVTRASSIKNRESRIEHPERKKPYASPEIAKVKMQPEQAVLTCCQVTTNPKISGDFGKCAVTGCGSEESCTAPSFAAEDSETQS